MIHKHQILALKEYGEFNNTLAGFIFNFRNEKQQYRNYILSRYKDFTIMINEVNKKSFNKNDLLKYNPIEINGTKKELIINGILMDSWKM